MAILGKKSRSFFSSLRKTLVQGARIKKFPVNSNIFLDFSRIKFQHILKQAISSNPLAFLDSLMAVFHEIGSTETQEFQRDNDRKEIFLLCALSSGEVSSRFSPSNNYLSLGNFQILPSRQFTAARYF